MPSKYYHLVPPEHKCAGCGGNKDEVNFSAKAGRSGKMYHYLKCNKCRYTPVNIDGRSLRYKNKTKKANIKCDRIINAKKIELKFSDKFREAMKGKW